MVYFLIFCESISLFFKLFYSIILLDQALKTKGLTQSAGMTHSRELVFSFWAHGTIIFKALMRFKLINKIQNNNLILKVRLLLGAVHADFVLLGLSKPQSELLIGANKKDLELKLSKRLQKKKVEERLQKVGQIN